MFRGQTGFSSDAEESKKNIGLWFLKAFSLQRMRPADSRCEPGVKVISTPTFQPQHLPATLLQNINLSFASKKMKQHIYSFSWTLVHRLEKDRTPSSVYWSDAEGIETNINQ